MISLGYLPYIQQQDKFSSQIHKDKIREAEVLLENFWIYLNPTSNKTISKINFYQLIKLLQTNVGKLSDSELAAKMASLIIVQASLQDQSKIAQNEVIHEKQDEASESKFEIIHSKIPSFIESQGGK